MLHVIVIPAMNLVTLLNVSFILTSARFRLAVCLIRPCIFTATATPVIYTRAAFKPVDITFSHELVGPTSRGLSRRRLLHASAARIRTRVFSKTTEHVIAHAGSACSVGHSFFIHHSTSRPHLYLSCGSTESLGPSSG
ncbi:hypothetical protein BHM03_00020891 [Ensete ventricosum]|nr:hypothetical protein BHM03_00020891 [Ensete ventricosum]